MTADVPTVAGRDELAKSSAAPPSAVDAPVGVTARTRPRSPSPRPETKRKEQRVSEDQLFEWPVRAKLAKRERTPPEMVRLAPPWRLIATVKGAPIAHRNVTVLTSARQDGRSVIAAGTALAPCGARGYVVDVDGSPLAPACGACYRAGS